MPRSRCWRSHSVGGVLSQPLQRVLASLQSLAALPAEVITWNQIFVALNEAQTTVFDVVHPVIEVVINDPEMIAQLRNGAALQFSVGIGPGTRSAAPPYLRTSTN